MDDIATCERDLASMESRIKLASAYAGEKEGLPQADLDMFDLCFSMASDLVGVFIESNGDIAKWLESFISRNGEKAYVVFHRLLFGYDVLVTGRDPFARVQASHVLPAPT